MDAFWYLFEKPRVGEVYNMGGGRTANCSMLEAIEMTQEITGHQLRWTYSSTNRMGDHIWWVSDLSRFTEHYPTWKIQYRIRDIMRTVVDSQLERIKTVTPR